MSLVISHFSAADFWRTVYPLNRMPVANGPFALPNDLASTDEDVWSLAPPWVTPQFLEREHGVLHTLVSSQAHRRPTGSHAPHVWTSPLPPKSLCQLTEDVFVSSPQFTFLQLASVLDFAQLTAYGFELCGLYSFDEKAERGFRTRSVPLLEKRVLEQYVHSAFGAYGHKKCLPTVRHVAERSASPMETVVDLLECLPYKRGGYCIGQPELNYEIPLKGKARALYPKGHCVADLYWRDYDLGMEFLGMLDHTGGSAVMSDRGRTNALAEMGLEIIELTSQQVWNPEAFEAIVLRVAKRMGKSIPGKHLGRTAARMSLRASLRSWNKASGRV